MSDVEVDLNVSIPGEGLVDEQCPVPPNPDSLPSHNSSDGGTNIDYALQAACKEELSHGIFPKFEIRAVENKAKTREKGRPFFEDVEYVTVTIAGDKNSKIDREVTDIDRKRWPALYQAFKQGMEVARSGTPLEQWTLMTPGVVANLKHYGVFTVEDLANLSDTAIQSIGLGTRELTKKAQAFLESAENAAAPARMAEQIDQLTKQVEALEISNKQLGAAARSAEMHITEMQTLKENAQADAVRIENLQAELAAMTNKNATLEVELSTLKNELKSVRSQLTKAKNEIDKLSNNEG